MNGNFTEEIKGIVEPAIRQAIKEGFVLGTKAAVRFHWRSFLIGYLVASIFLIVGTAVYESIRLQAGG